jgi:hypothetical protein
MKPSKRTQKARAKREVRKKAKRARKFKARKAVERAERKPKPPRLRRLTPKQAERIADYLSFRKWKKTELTAKEAFKVVKQEKAAQRIRIEYGRKGLEWMDAKILADTYPLLDKKVMRKYNMPSLERFAEEYLKWLKSEHKDVVKHMEPWERGEAFMEHLEAEISGVHDFVERLGVELEFSSDVAMMRMQEAGISGQAMLDAGHHLKQFMRLFREKNLWRPEAVDYFSQKLKLWKERNYPKVESIEGLREKVAADLKVELDLVEELVRQTRERVEKVRGDYLAKDEEVEIAEGILRQAEKEAAKRRAFRSYMVQLVGREAHRFGLKRLRKR